MEILTMVGSLIIITGSAFITGFFFGIFLGNVIFEGE